MALIGFIPQLLLKMAIMQRPSWECNILITHKLTEVLTSWCKAEIRMAPIFFGSLLLLIPSKNYTKITFSHPNRWKWTRVRWGTRCTRCRARPISQPSRRLTEWLPIVLLNRTIGNHSFIHQLGWLRDIRYRDITFTHCDISFTRLVGGFEIEAVIVSYTKSAFFNQASVHWWG